MHNQFRNVVNFEIDMYESNKNSVFVSYANVTLTIADYFVKQWS